jgi:hypothetical protein
MSVVYVKMFHNENEVTYSTQKVLTVVDTDQYGNVTAKWYNDKIKDYEIVVLRPDQFSEKPFLMDFN